MNHRWTPDGPVERFEILASVQPVRGLELTQTLQLDATAQAKVLLTVADLKTGDEDGQTGPDVVEIDGEDYEVHKVEDWRETSLAHRRVWVVRREKT